MAAASATSTVHEARAAQFACLAKAEVEKWWPKRLQCSAIPNAALFGVLADPAFPATSFSIADLQAAARMLGLHHHDYLHAVAESFANAGAVLITGPANAKIKLVKHIHHHDPKLMNVIAGVETVDHPNDAELVAYARKYLKATDLMQPQR